MTFLQPILLYALPLILLPVIIHLINRLRYRRQVWAAMPFLLAASRSSVSHAKLKQWLVLFLRVLAVLALIIALTRPLAGGWLGWGISAAPDAIIMLLDRSASMNRMSDDRKVSGLQQVLGLFEKSASDFEGQSLLILLDSAGRTAVELSRSSDIYNHPTTQPTDTEADIPAMIRSALDWILDNQAGTVEIWIGSDMQAGNWKPDDPRWDKIREDFGSLPQKVKFRLLEPEKGRSQNVSISLIEMYRRYGEGGSRLSLVADLIAENPFEEPIPLTFHHKNSVTQIELPAEGSQFRWRHLLDLGAEGEEDGWGYLELPADSNASDNRAWLVYGPKLNLKAKVYSTLPFSGKILGLASISRFTDVNPSEFLSYYASPEGVMMDDWSETALVIWQGPFPSNEANLRLSRFIEEGGQVLFLPPAEATPDPSNSFNGVAWGGIQSPGSSELEAFAIARWERSDGPLQDTDEGFPLSVDALEVYQFREFRGGGRILASFPDGAPLLTMRTEGKGAFYVLTTLPEPEWSTLSDGLLMVPLTQRLMERGATRLDKHRLDTVGVWKPLTQRTSVEGVGGSDGEGGGDYRIQSGVYQAGDQWIALNLPVGEHAVEYLESDRVVGLFRDLGVHYFGDSTRDTTPVQGEIWRFILISMLLFLLVEAILILPPAPREINSTR